MIFCKYYMKKKHNGAIYSKNCTMFSQKAENYFLLCKDTKHKDRFYVVRILFCDGITTNLKKVTVQADEINKNILKLSQTHDTISV